MTGLYFFSQRTLDVDVWNVFPAPVVTLGQVTLSDVLKAGAE